MREDIFTQALVEYAAKRGRRWKSHLNSDWNHAAVPEGPLLRRLRNETCYGPRWLKKFRLPTRKPQQEID